MFKDGAVIVALLAAAVPTGARAQQAAGAPVTLPDIDVVGTTPLLGSGIDRDRVPQATQVLTSQDIDRTNVPSLTGALLDNIPSATVTDVSGNMFQPDILFRGFAASPVAGTAQGLAVYVNGARFNDPFGDTVNWDLIPSIAIDTLNVEASNPVFGLNALGGSVNVQLKNGFTFQGGDATGYGGSFDRESGILEFGRQLGDFAIYGAGEITHDGGYRQTQSSDIYRLYTDLGYRHDDLEIHLSIDAADNTLGNPGASPVQELYAHPTGIFTGPNAVFNKYVSVNLNGSYALNDTTTVQALAYYETLTQRVTNGATQDGGPCSPPNGLFCNNDGSVATTFHNQPIPDFLNGGVYSALVLEGLEAHSYGASAQATNESTILGHKNHLTVGASFDGGDSVFNANTLLGGFSNDGTQLFVGPPDYILVQPGQGIQPVKVATVTRYYGLFAADVLTLAQGLDLSLNGRFNNAEIDTHDKLGTVLSGQHSYNRFNPSAGLTYEITPALQVYGSYSEANRAPTPTELSCSSAANPCSLLNFFIGDPDLKQVVARTFEGGLRGRLPDLLGGRFAWSADYFHTKDRDDLIFQTALNNPNIAFYTNAGSTLRQGAEANLHYDSARLHVVLGYAFTDATYQSPLLLGSASNPFADVNGNEHVIPGDRIPGIPQHRGTAVLDYKITERWTVGGNAVLTSNQERFGDEANLGKPVGGYAVVNFDTSYRISDNVTVFGLINNLTNQRYGTYGTYGPVDQVPFPNTPGGVTDPRTASPGVPIAGYGGVRVRF